MITFLPSYDAFLVVVVVQLCIVNEVITFWIHCIQGSPSWKNPVLFAKNPDKFHFHHAGLTPAAMKQAKYLACPIIITLLV